MDFNGTCTTPDLFVNEFGGLILNTDAAFASVRVTGSGLLDAEANLSVADFQLDNGTLTGAGTVTITDAVNGGTFDWTGGSLNALHSFVLAGDATMTIEGPNGKAVVNSTVDLFGTVNWSGGPIGFGGAVWNVQPSGAFAIQTDNLTLGGYGLFQNQGTVTGVNLTGRTTVGVPFRNENGGVVRVISGILEIDDFSQNGDVSVTDVAAGARLESAGTLRLDGGILSGSGTVMVSNGNGTLDNVAGVISPGGDGTIGTLTIAGNLVNEPLGTVNIDIDGVNPGSDYDYLLVTGTVTLNGGTLNIRFGPDYAPTDQDSFVVLTGQRGVSGDGFTSYAVNGLDPSFQVGEQVSGNDMVLTVLASGGAPAGHQGRHGMDPASLAEPAAGHSSPATADAWTEAAFLGE